MHGIEIGAKNIKIYLGSGITYGLDFEMEFDPNVTNVFKHTGGFLRNNGAQMAL